MWSKFFGEFAPLRAFFILACVFVGFGCVGFVFAPNFFILTHKFIFLQSVMGAAFAGFLLTALPIWLGFKGSLKLVSLILSTLLILAFVAEFFLDAYFIMALFWFILLSKAVFMAFAAKNAKNLSILFVLFGIFCLTLLQDFSRDTRLEYAQIHLLVVGILLISFKISLVLGNDALANFGVNLSENLGENSVLNSSEKSTRQAVFETRNLGENSNSSENLSSNLNENPTPNSSTNLNSSKNLSSNLNTNSTKNLGENLAANSTQIELFEIQNSSKNLMLNSSENSTRQAIFETRNLSENPASNSAKNSHQNPNLAQNPAKNSEFSAKIPTNFAFIPNFALKNIACFLLGCLILSTLWGESANLSGFLALSVGFLQLSRLKEWHYGIFLKTPYTATFYALNLALSLVYIALGGFYLADFATSPAIHALNILILLGFVLFVFFIASLKHTQNQPFIFSRGMKMCFVALFLGTLLRCIFAPALANSEILGLISSLNTQFFENKNSSLNASFFENKNPFLNTQLLENKGIFAEFIENSALEIAYIYAPAMLIFAAFLYFVLKFIPIFRKNAFKDMQIQHLA